MEFGTIEREIEIDASPAVVFDVISSPAHIRDWWGGAETAIEQTVGSTSELVWTDAASGRTETVAITVVEAEPPRRFSFRWTQPEGETPTPDNSLLVTFDLEAAGDGTVLRMVESGFREQGWDAAKLEATYNDHVSGWDIFVPQIGEVATRIAA